MKTLLLVVCVFVCVTSYAQEKIPLDSLKVGDQLILDKKCRNVLDYEGMLWTLYPSTWMVTYVFVYEGKASYIEVFSQRTGETKKFDIIELYHFERKNKLHCNRL